MEVATAGMSDFSFFLFFSRAAKCTLTSPKLAKPMIDPTEDIPNKNYFIDFKVCITYPCAYHTQYLL